MPTKRPGKRRAQAATKGPEEKNGKARTRRTAKKVGAGPPQKKVMPAKSTQAAGFKALFRELGYLGPEGGGTGAIKAAALGPVAVAAPENEPPLFDAADLAAIEQALEMDPQGTMAKIRAGWDAKVTEEDVRNALEQARAALDNPGGAATALAAKAAHKAKAMPLPPGFSFPGMNLQDIPIEPGQSKFETFGDVLGWLFLSGPKWLATQNQTPPDFRFHTSEQPFIYPLAEPGADRPLEIALFSDFGTGYYHSRYIARDIERQKLPYAIHLGDVYYAGRQSEFDEFFRGPLDSILPHTSLFALNSNHEMYSLAVPYFRYMDFRRGAFPARQLQQGSYFCLRSAKFQLLGIDTASHGRARFREKKQKEWLAARLAEGRKQALVNILLSADHPYDYGEKGLTTLLRNDLASLAIADGLVDLWFWGNTHYCALFDSSTATPFVGSCIGHGGYPYSTKRKGEAEPAPVRFLETRHRFHPFPLRKDRGNNGYCVLSLTADGGVNLRYVDWMRNVRCRATLSKDTAAGRWRVSTIQEG